MTTQEEIERAATPSPEPASPPRVSEEALAWAAQQIEQKAALDDGLMGRTWAEVKASASPPRESEDRRKYADMVRHVNAMTDNGRVPPPEAPAPARKVTDEMVERALMTWKRDLGPDFKAMRAALVAALATDQEEKP